MKNISLLDGGIGQEINKRSKRSSSHQLWSVQVMFEEPEIVVSVHKDFILAGSRVITVNNYTATPFRLAEYGLGEKFFETHQLAIELAQRAISEASGEVVMMLMLILLAVCRRLLQVTFPLLRWAKQRLTTIIES